MNNSDTSGGKFRRKKTNFSMIPNDVIRDGSLSLRAKGLYALIQSYITNDNFTLYKSYLMRQCQEGKKAFESAWKELKDAGYLIQYRMQDSKTKTFFWEYELLDSLEPDTLNGGMDINEPYSRKGVYGKRMAWPKDDMGEGVHGKGGHINNTLLNNTLLDNNRSKQIISIKDVKKQIGYSSFNSIDREQVDEIALLILDVYSLPNESAMRINRCDVPAYRVKERFMTLDSMHVRYVLDAMEKSSSICNVRSYLLTALYNAPSTMNAFYTNLANNNN